jgi:hypothetical protein
MNIVSIEPKVPISKPLPNKEIYNDEENRDATKKTNGMTPAKRINLSRGIVNFPSPNLATSQKNRDIVNPTDIRKPLLASRVTGMYGIKKNKEPNNVANKVTNDNLLKNNTFFDSIGFCVIYNNVFIIPNRHKKY